MFHTQERRQRRLSSPIKCVRLDAWLGPAYYYWYDLQDAFDWGQSSKRGTGYFEIYRSDIECNDVLDTVFNEDQYKFWMESIEKVAKTFLRKTGRKPATRYINEYFKDRGIWASVKGIMFQDIPARNEYVMVIGFYYKKRIQLAVYDPGIILTFELNSVEQCV
jgi:hypothetical protein